MRKNMKLVLQEDVVLKTTADCYNTLLNGFILNCRDSFVKLQNGKLIDCCNNNTQNISFINPSDWRVYAEEEIHWYENIPKEGVLCWADSGKTFPMVVVRYKSEGVSRFVTKAEDDMYTATPLTKEELLKYAKIAEDLGF